MTYLITSSLGAPRRGPNPSLIPELRQRRPGRRGLRPLAGPVANEKGRLPQSGGDPLATEKNKTMLHRISEYEALGFSRPAATLMAQTDHEPEKIAGWLRAGCTAEQAMRIAL